VAQKKTLYTLLLVMGLLLSACASNAPSAPVEPAGPTATRQIVVVTATPEPSATPKPLNPVQATAQALFQSVTLVAPTAGPGPDDYVGMLEEAWNIVNQNYVRDNFNGVDWPAMLQKYRPLAEKVTNQEEFWNLMTQFIGELNDQHSRFVPPDRFSIEFNLPSDAEGSPWTGIQFWPGPAREDQFLTIWYVCEFGPAASAGLRRGDRILAVDGTQLIRSEDGFDQDLVYQAVFGDGSSNRVTLTVQQGEGSAPKDVTLPLGGASGCDGWQIGILNQNPRIGYLRIPNFEGGPDTTIMDALDSLEQDGPLDGLVLDVRHDPGGNSDASTAIFTQGTFGTEGPLREGKSRSLYRIRGPVKWNETTPIALLIDGASHSAAEYFATAMQQSGRATLVGMPTAGNTEGINAFNLPDGSVIRLAWTTLLLPDGSSLEGVGVQPDVRVPLGDWGLRAVPDVQLQAALNVLLGR
jgi:carboxyl-terminal processing protease